ncbi:MAG: hypothetical protein KAW41_02150 [Candidatus Diapherotrites archaeon]|nr:hypothetical protein [Candidatus Diapherotrites archaeon]
MPREKSPHPIEKPAIEFAPESKKKLAAFFSRLKGRDAEDYVNQKYEGQPEELKAKELGSVRAAIADVSRTLSQGGAVRPSIGKACHEFLISKEVAMWKEGETMLKHYSQPVTRFLVLHPGLIERLGLKRE